LTARTKNKLTKSRHGGLSYEEVRPLIEKYCRKHLKFIQDLERLFRHCQKNFEEVEDPNIKNRCNSTIERLERDLRDFRDMTPEVLRNAELMHSLLASNRRELIPSIAIYE
jgi:hypothetical protein